MCRQFALSTRRVLLKKVVHVLLHDERVEGLAHLLRTSTRARHLCPKHYLGRRQQLSKIRSIRTFFYVCILTNLLTSESDVEYPGDISSVGLNTTEGSLVGVLHETMAIPALSGFAVRHPRFQD